jgi:cyanate permease
MKWWKYILAFLIVPLGAPIAFAVWSGLAFEPRSYSAITSAFPSFVLLTAPAAYIVALFFGIPAVLLLSSKGWLTFPAIFAAGTFIGTISGLMTGFYIGGYDMNGMLEYFTLDLVSIYAPSTISGMVSSIIYWVIRAISDREKS